MLPYQEEYLQNVGRIAELYASAETEAAGPETWLMKRRQAEREMDSLRERNLRLLNDCLFPVLDELHSASGDVISGLTEFAASLMDWRTNLDCGVYVTIHDALLSYYRLRRDRNAVIRELYLLGMGLYYLRRMVSNAGGYEAPFLFRNEMVFTEAGSYIRYYDEIDDQDTRGYIVRALANIALCTQDHHRRIAASARVLDIIRDEHFRALAPGLPWDAFLRGTHQQMSANRDELSRGSLTKDELALVLDSCYEVFKPEEGAEDPSVRWLWPYYEMEYSCGYADLRLTLDRMERLISGTEPDRYDMSGLYGNVQLAIYYGRLMRANPRLREDGKRVRFLDRACRKMIKCLLSCPREAYGDYLFFTLETVISGYFEMEGLPSYRSLTLALMRRYAPDLYLSGRQAGDMLRCLCAALLDRDPAFFDDIPFLAGTDDPAGKRAALLDYAGDCGLFFEFGMLKMNVGRIRRTRSLFDLEERMLRLHTVSGWNDLRERPSTARFADVALGHHSWYDGTGGYPESYRRTDSPFRQMTDAAAVVSHMQRHYDGDLPALLDSIFRQEQRAFSPLITACLGSEDTAGHLGRILAGGTDAYLPELFPGTADVDIPGAEL